MADLASLMRIAPGTAAYMVGQEQGQGQVENTLKQKQLAELINELQIRNSQSQAMNPLLVQHQDLQNQGLSAGLPGITADSRTKGLAADFTSATQPGAVQKTNSDNATAVGANKTKDQNRIAQGFIDMAPWLEQIPPELGQRSTAAMGRLREFGLNENSPQGQQFLQMISSTNPAELPKILEKLGKRMIQNSPKYLEEMDKTNATNVSREKVGAGNNAATIRAAQIAADSRVAVQNAKKGALTGLQALATAKNYGAAATMAQAMMLTEEDPEERAKLQKFSQLMAAQDLAAKQAAGTANKLDVPGMIQQPAAKTINPIAEAGNTADVQPNSGLSGGAQAAPPAAVQMLRQNPKLAAMFDAKYGQGAAAGVLGQ